jgi:hypothetical protein
MPKQPTSEGLEKSQSKPPPTLKRPSPPPPVRPVRGTVGNDKIIFEASLKQTGKTAVKVDADGEAEVVFIVSALEMPNLLPILGHGQATFKITVEVAAKLEDNTGDEYGLQK